MKKPNFLECFLVCFGSRFPLKFNEQIDTRIDAEQVMKNMKKHVKMVSKSIRILIVSEVAFREKMSFLKKVDVRKPHDSCSRIGVCEGPSKKKEIKKIGKVIKYIFKNRARKGMQK